MAGFDNQNLERALPLMDSMERILLFNAASTLISRGPPERRLLNTSKQDIGKHGHIRRWVFGVKNPGKMMRTIVLLGETGTGKSTLINMMTTYILGVEWSDNIRYEIIKEKVRDQTESQTSEVTVYEIFGYEDDRVPFSLRIIDTPGYGDTNGERRAKKIVETLCHLFQCEDGVHHIDAVCLVVKASQNRLTPHQRCIFDAILSLFGKDTKKNIIPVITFSGGGKPAALAAIDKFGFEWCRDEKNNLVHFRFDNAPEEESDEYTPPGYFKEAWDKRKKSMEAFFMCLSTLETRSLVMTHEVLFKQEELECCVNSLQDRIKQTEHKQNEIRQTQEALEKNKKEIEENNNFEYVVEESFADKVESDRFATYCKKCQFTCHHPCSVFHDIIFWCAVMSYKDCVSCSGKCSLSFHVTEKMRYVPSVRKVKKTYKELKKKYEESSRGFESLHKKLQEELSKLESEKHTLILKAYTHIIRLNEIALRPESLSILVNLNFLIEKLRETKQTEKVQKLEDIHKRAMEAHNLQGEEQGSLFKILPTI